MKIRVSHKNQPRTTTARRLRTAASVLIASGILVGSGVLAAPANAGEPAFRIYYSPNCTGAARTYTGKNFGESWINDKFNSVSAPGLNQKIVRNAASVRVYGAVLRISTDNGTSFTSYNRTGACMNLGAARNHNTYWTLLP